MRKLALLAIMALTLVAPAARADTTLLAVDDGIAFYDLTGDCKGDTDVPTRAVAIQRWNVGVPYADAKVEAPNGGGGARCDLTTPGPRSWTVNVPAGKSAHVTGRLRYSWDANQVGAPGGNQVHLHVFDAANNNVLIFSTAQSAGMKPTTPNARAADFSIGFDLANPGQYVFQEDVWSGSNTMWVTKLTVTTF